MIAPGVAHAQDQVYAQVEGGVSAILSAPQSDRYGVGGYGEARVGLRLLDVLGVHLAAGYWNWAPRTTPTDPNTPVATRNGTLAVYSAGARGSLPLSRALGRVVLDLDLGIGVTGADASVRFGFGLGVGWLIPVHRLVALGPVLRYHQIVGSTGDNDARIFSGGIAVAFPGRATEPAAPAPEPPPPAVAPPPPAPPVEPPAPPAPILDSPAPPPPAPPSAPVEPEAAPPAPTPPVAPPTTAATPPATEPEAPDPARRHRRHGGHHNRH